MYIDTDPEEKKDFHHHFQSHPHRRMSVRTRETSAPSIKSLRQLPATKVGDFVVDLTRDLICPNRILDVRYLGTKETTSKSKWNRDEEQSNRSTMNKEHGIDPVLWLPHNRKFNVVKIRKAIPGRKQATLQETEARPE
ncbi:hypothetical protein B296_00023046 [Ensete ventricosum]|uniref:Uncharacterized protein n=1 Tax=Ensete ventricosum TaxID=4639 RepID=A0A426Y9J2_ENSVE|nr:hypothetical protein B296_00023046 [Ensete ventricosum]